MTHEQASASLEVGDKIYLLARLTGMDSEWSEKVIKSINLEIKLATGIDLADA